MRALVTGAKGMLGQDLCPVLEKNGYFVIKTDIDNLDITNEQTTDAVIEAVKPDLIVHCAAYTNVDKAEKELDKARLINSTGTKNIALSAGKNNVTLVYISTDYVFDGAKKTPYLPTDKPNPVNNYGLTKLEGEEAVLKYCKKYYIARTSWLYGIHGKNFVETMISLKDKDILKVVDDQIGCPTWTMELIQGIIKILKKPYGIYHISGSGQTSWYEFAKEIFDQENLKVNIVPCKTDEFPRDAKRPSYSVMENEGITRNWKEALKDYLALRKDNK